MKPDEVIATSTVTPFPSGGRVLVSARPGREDEFESWSAFDSSRSVDEQHRDLQERTHRLFKARVRRILNGLAKSYEGTRCLAKLRHDIASVGYDPLRFNFIRVVRECEQQAAFGPDLAMLVESALVAGFVTNDEACLLLIGQEIGEGMEPRPAHVPPGPPIVLEEL